ncbi:MAG: hypothetical protein ACR2K9_01100 [Solirubrobacteraceae bacterium]
MKTQVPATIVGYWAGSTKALLQLPDGQTVEATAPPALEDKFSVGDEAMVYYDGEGKVIGWYLIDLNAGVNLRYSETA